MAAHGSSLPSRFPVFPLRGALLLPGGSLPLNIFEPRYLAMMQDAMRTERAVGMVQPTSDDEGAEPPLYRTGCLGRITRFAGTEDGRMLVLLTGVCRFDIAEELPTATPYRQVVASFERWLADLAPEEPPVELRSRLLPLLGAYLDRLGAERRLEELHDAPVSALVTTLAMALPFAPEEKQALLEAPDLQRQGELLIALLAFALHDDGAGDRPN